MAVIVKIRIFSGRRNPSWSLNEEQIRDLDARLRMLPAGVTQTFRIGGLGYHGFSVHPGPDVESPQLQHPFAVYGGTIDYFDKVVAQIDTGRELERWLLNSEPNVDPTVRAQVAYEFDTIYQDPQCKGYRPEEEILAGRPIYNPGLWNNAASGVLGSNNCYSYANDLYHFDTGDHATPGESASMPTQVGTCAQFLTAALADTLTKIEKLPAKGPPLALFVRPNQSDYHWYRQDRSGLWSHKPGGFPVRDCDESGDPITNPEKANVLDYVFCDYFQTSPAARKIIS